MRCPDCGYEKLQIHTIDDCLTLVCHICGYTKTLESNVKCVTCERCGGTGVIPHPNKDLFSFPYYCPECGGTGERLILFECREKDEH